MMNNEATHVKTQEDYSKFSSIVNEFLQEQMNEDFMEKNLLEAGVTSLQMMRISNALRKHGYKISFAKMISDPYVKHWWDNADINVKRKSVPPLETSNNSPKQFPLTDVQYAYWVGRKEGQVLGGNACHAYFEFDPDTVNLERLQEAWEELQARHPMLRAKFNNNGTQEIMEKPYSAKLQIYDFRKSDDFEHDLLAVREKLSHRKLDIANGQVAELGISLLPEDKLRMHFDIDLLVADMQSLQIIFRDLAAIYNSEYRPAIPENWDFDIYLENEKNNKINDYRKAEKYWKSEIESLPLGPALTLRTQPETIAAPKFSRRKYLLEHKKWEKLKSLAAQYCTTPAMVLLTLYAAVLDRWSTNQSYDIYIKLLEQTEIRRENAIYEKQISLFQEQIYVKETAMLNDKMVRDKFYHQLSFIKELVYQRELSQLNEFIDGIMQNKKIEKDGPANSGNVLLDYIVNNKCEIAVKQGIECTVKIEVPYKFPFSDGDIFIILGNALDNAIEGALKCVSRRYIHIKIIYRKENLFIKISNSFDGKVKKDRHGHLISMKSDLTRYGLGLALIEKSVNKYNGLLNFDIDEENFTLTVLLYS